MKIILSYYLDPCTFVLYILHTLTVEISENYFTRFWPLSDFIIDQRMFWNFDLLAFILL